MGKLHRRFSLCIRYTSLMWKLSEISCRNMLGKKRRAHTIWGRKVHATCSNPEFRLEDADIVSNFSTAREAIVNGSKYCGWRHLVQFNHSRKIWMLLNQGRKANRTSRVMNLRKPFFLQYSAAHIRQKTHCS